MSAAFAFADHLHWGTNGSVEAYLEALAQIAVERFGVDDSLAAVLSGERDRFYSGSVVYLDAILTNAADRLRFVRLLEMVTDKLLREEAFTEVGREWVATEIHALRERIENAARSATET